MFKDVQESRNKGRCRVLNRFSFKITKIRHIRDFKVNFKTAVSVETGYDGELTSPTAPLLGLLERVLMGVATQNGLVMDDRALPPWIVDPPPWIVGR